MNNAERHSPPPQTESQLTAATSDAALLERFARNRDEAAFAELVSRYGNLVFGVCRRVLVRTDDVEDAFQAAFLVLARDANKIRKRRSLASWLYGVAHRIALRARAMRSRRREESLPGDVMGQANPLAELANRQEREAVDEELNELPAKYRDPLVLHYLMGRTSREIAEELRLSISATEGRLRRGREKLRSRLARRGIGMAAVLTAIHLLESTGQAAVSNALITSTVQAGVAFSGTGRPGVYASEEAARLAGKEIGTMSITSTATLTTVAVIALTLGISDHTSTSSAASGEGFLEVRTTAPPADESAASVRRIVPAGGNSGAPNGASAVRAGNRRSGSQNAGMGIAGMGIAEKSGVTDYKRRTQLVTKIESALVKHSAVDFVDATLREAVVQLADLHGIPIHFDEKAVSAGEIKLDKAVNLQIKGATLRSVLGLILEPMDLDYVVKHEVLQITTRQAAEALVDTRVYNVGMFKNTNPESLVELIQQSIRPQSWRQASSNRTAANTVKRPKPNSFITTINGALVVTQSQRGHDAIRDLLEQLARGANR